VKSVQSVVKFLDWRLNAYYGLSQLPMFDLFFPSNVPLLHCSTLSRIPVFPPPVLLSPVYCSTFSRNEGEGGVGWDIFGKTWAFVVAESEKMIRFCDGKHDIGLAHEWRRRG